MNKHDWLIGVLSDIENYARVNNLKRITSATSDLIDTTILEINETMQSTTNIIQLSAYRTTKVSLEVLNVVSWIENMPQ